MPLANRRTPVRRALADGMGDRTPAHSRFVVGWQSNTALRAGFSVDVLEVALGGCRRRSGG